MSCSGYVKYLYSPRPKPCRAMTTWLRNRPSSPYRPAIVSHSSAVRSCSTIAQPWSSRCVETLVQSSIPTRVLMPTASVCVVFTTERMRRPPAEIVPIPGRSTWKRFWLTLGKRPGSPVREVPSRLPKSRRNYVDALDAEKRPSEAIAEVVEAAQVPEWDGNAREGWLPGQDSNLRHPD